MPSGLDIVSIDRLKVCYLAEDYLYTPSKNAEEKVPMLEIGLM